MRYTPTSPGTLPANIALYTAAFDGPWTSPSTVVQRPWQGPLLARDLAEKPGYRTGLFAAADMSFPRADCFLIQANYERFIHSGICRRPTWRAKNSTVGADGDDLMAQRAIGWARPYTGKKTVLPGIMSNAPHHPYSVPEDFGHAAGDSRLERYKHALTYADQAVGRIVGAMGRPACAKHGVVVTGDHGDGFGEHGRHGHRESGYDEA